MKKPTKVKRDLSRSATLPKITEKAWSAQFRQLFRTLGYDLAYHTLHSLGSEPGYPDWHLTHPNGRDCYVELKAENGKLSPRQAAWIERLQACGHEVYCWKPSDFDLAAETLRRKPKCQHTHELRSAEPRKVTALEARRLSLADMERAEQRRRDYVVEEAKHGVFRE